MNDEIYGSGNETSTRSGARNQILVCVSPAATTARVIQVAGTMARTSGVGLVALHVKTRPDWSILAEDQRRLREHFALVRRLGGDIEIVQGKNIVKEIARYVEKGGFRSIVIGRQRMFRRWDIVGHSDIAASVLKRLRDFDIHVIPGEPGDAEPRVRLPRETAPGKKTGRKIAAIARAPLILIAAVAAGMFFYHIGFTESNIIMVFLLAVLAISATESRLLGLITSAVTVFLFNFLFTEPRFTLVVYESQDVITFLVMFIVAFFASELTTRIKKQAETARIRELRTDMLYNATRSLLKAHGTSDVARTAVDYLKELLHREVMCILPQSDGKWNLVNSDGTFEDNASNEKEVAPEVQRVLERFDSEEKLKLGYSTGHRYYHPLIIQGRLVGIVGVDIQNYTLENAQYSLLEVVAGQLSLALDRERLALAEEEARLLIEHERLRSNLLQSISHDLRTPLTAIMGSSTLLLKERLISESPHAELLEGIRDDATWLTSVVENLLSLTKLDKEEMVTQTEWEVVDDLLVEAAERCRNRSTTNRIHVELPDESVVVLVDARLIEQVLVNLIDNAIRYSPPETSITVTAVQSFSSVIFEVRDKGAGLSEEALQHVFDRFYAEKPRADARRGLGLGLAICKSIVDAHGGSISAENDLGGGAIFRFELPRFASSETGFAPLIDGEGLTQ